MLNHQQNAQQRFPPAAVAPEYDKTRTGIISLSLSERGGVGGPAFVPSFVTSAWYFIV
jgi:hypothetical protein